ncbi:MAG: hypothetical protein ING01_11320 [Rhodobacter sp.]|nr:hypothetical protein [Rhodobacter sp.]
MDATNRSTRTREVHPKDRPETPRSGVFAVRLPAGAPAGNMLSTSLTAVIRQERNRLTVHEWINDASSCYGKNIGTERRRRPERGSKVTLSYPNRP